MNSNLNQAGKNNKINSFVSINEKWMTFYDRQGINVIKTLLWTPANAPMFAIITFELGLL